MVELSASHSEVDGQATSDRRGSPRVSGGEHPKPEEMRLVRGLGTGEALEVTVRTAYPWLSRMRGIIY